MALGDVLVIAKSLSLDRVERSIVAMETVLHQLRPFPFSTKLWHSLLGVPRDSRNASEATGRNLDPVSYFTSNNLTHYWASLESIIPELRETILFLRNVSHDPILFSCAHVLKAAAKLILYGLLHKNTSQRTLCVLLNSTFSSENTIGRLQGCMAARMHGMARRPKPSVPEEEFKLLTKPSSQNLGEFQRDERQDELHPAHCEVGAKETTLFIEWSKYKLFKHLLERCS